MGVMDKDCVVVAVAEPVRVRLLWEVRDRLRDGCSVNVAVGVAKTTTERVGSMVWVREELRDLDRECGDDGVSEML